MSYFQTTTDADKLTVYIMAEIGYYSDDSDLSKIIKESDAKEIELIISSGGGSVFEGIKVFNSVATHAAKTTAIIYGATASAASYIAMAADTVKMYDNALLCVHNPFTFARGDGDELRKIAKTLDDLKAIYIQAYKRHSKLSDEELSVILNQDIWLTASEASEKGFIEEIIKVDNETATLVASIYAKNFKPKTNGGNPPQIKSEKDNKMDYENMDIAALFAAILTLVEGSDNAEEIGKVIDAIKSKIPDEAATEEVPNPDTDTPEASAVAGIQAIVAEYRKANNDGRLDGIAFDAIANKSTLAAFTSQMVAILAQAPVVSTKKETPNPSRFIAGAGGGKPGKSKDELWTEYSALATPQARDEYRRKNDTVMFS